MTTVVAERSQPGLNVFQGGGEFLTGRQRFPFGLGIGGATEQIEKGSAAVWVARGAQVAGPLKAPFQTYRAPGEGDPAGFFVTDITIPDGEGAVDLLVEANGRYGFAAILPKDEPTLPAPGQRAIEARTPTTTQTTGVNPICTRDVPCEMHDVSLHAVLGARPVVFAIASPKLCTSRTCGPVLEEILAVRAEHEADAAFIHVEPYAGDSVAHLSPAATAWKIPSEPWTFVIAADGRVSGRFEGPVVASEVEAALLAAI